MRPCRIDYGFSALYTHIVGPDLQSLSWRRIKSICFMHSCIFGCVGEMAERISGPEFVAYFCSFIESMLNTAARYFWFYFYLEPLADGEAC